MSFEPQPLNPFGWIIVLVFGFLMFFLGSVQTSSVSVMPEPRFGKPSVTSPRAARPMTLMPDNASLLAIEGVETLVRESFPPQVVLIVSGFWPDGCDLEPLIVTERSGNMISVRIYRIVPADLMCTMMMTPVTLEVSLTEVLMEGDSFRNGEYTIDVNGLIKNVTF